MSRKGWILVGVVAAVVVVLTFGLRIRDKVPDGPEYAQRLFVATNSARIDEGLPELEWNGCLAAVALDAAAQYQGETTITPAVDRPDCVGVGRTLELTPRGSYSPEDIVELWLSPGSRRDVLLDQEVTQIGIGCITVPTPNLPFATCSWVAAERATVG